MNWVIVIVMFIAGPFSVPMLEFETRNECVEYVNDPNNSDRLAIEVIAKAGFNDNIVAVICSLESSDMIEKEYKG